MRKNDELVFVYVWEYFVKTESLPAFEEAYHAEGTWVELFKKAEGYIATQLLKDDTKNNRYMTLDYWRTKADRDHFRQKFKDQFDLLDAHCEDFTLQENFLGDFHTHLINTGR